MGAIGPLVNGIDDNVFSFLHWNIRRNARPKHHDCVLDLLLVHDHTLQIESTKTTETRAPLFSHQDGVSTCFCIKAFLYDPMVYLLPSR
jgi:hypothetical protein